MTVMVTNFAKNGAGAKETRKKRDEKSAVAALLFLGTKAKISRQTEYRWKPRDSGSAAGEAQGLPAAPWLCSAGGGQASPRGDIPGL